MTVTVHNVPADISGAFTPTQSDLTVTTTTPGQNAQLTFLGVAGERIRLDISRVTLPLTKLSLRQPGGALLVPPTLVDTLGDVLDTPTLPLTGTYTVIIDPQAANTGSMTLRLVHASPNASGSLTPGGDPVTVVTTVPNERVRLIFNGNAGQRVSLKIGDSNIVTSSVAILTPDGTSVASAVVNVIDGANIGVGTGFIDTQTLPVTGIYTVVVDPENIWVGSMKLTLYAVPADISRTLTPNGPAAAITITTPGQNAALTFTGDSGQTATVRIANNAIGEVVVSLHQPDGAVLTTTTASSVGFTLSPQTLPTTGIYTLHLNPGGANTGNITVSVTSP